MDLLRGGDGIGNFYGILYETNDTGKTWRRQYFPNAPVFNSVLMINDSIVIISGDGKIYRTTNGGNYSSVSSQTYDFRLSTYPNPSTGIINIQYQLSSTYPVSLTYYNALGDIIATVDQGIVSSGIHQTSYDGSNLTNGTYYFSLVAGSNHDTGSFIIAK